MKKSETGFITRIVTLIMVCVMALSLIPNVSANAATTSKSTAYKSTKTMTCYLAGSEDEKSIITQGGCVRNP